VKFETINNGMIGIIIVTFFYSTLVGCYVMNRFVFFGILPGVGKVLESEKIILTA
jgi:hypothetical protein